MSDVDLSPGAFALPEPIQPLDAPEAEANDEMKATQLPPVSYTHLTLPTKRIV